VLTVTVGDRIRQVRQEQDVTQQELADYIGVSKQAVYKYENNIVTNIPTDKVDAIAKRLKVSPAYLMGWEEQPEPKKPTIPPGFEPMPKMDWVPLVGRIACGTPITAEENVEQMVCVPSRWHSTFTLTCKGDSMEPRIHDGDLVAIRSQPEVEQGEIAAVRIGDEATLKHVYLHENFIELRPENPAFESIILTKEKMNTVVIEGKAVGLCRDI
jgi:repressor LexA